MLKLKKILLPTDFSRCSDQAGAHALFLAARYKAELHILHVNELHGYYAQGSMASFDLETLQEIAEKYGARQMEATLGAHGVEGITVKRAQVRGISAAPAILQYGADHDVDLIVMGTHGRRGLGHLFLGSVAEEVVRFAQRPVLTVREREHPMAVDARRNILVPLDFSGYSNLAIRYAREIARLWGARVDLLHVIERPMRPVFYGLEELSAVETVPNIVASAKEHMEQYLDDLAGLGIETETHVLEGHAARDIVAFAESHNSNLIVIPTHGLTGIKHLLLGSVAEKVVRMAPCEVLVVKSFGKSLV